MAVYYHNVRVIGRKSGGNTVASAAYRHAAKMINDETGVAKNYEAKREELVHEEITLPDGAPQWAIGRYLSGQVVEASERLWNDIERKESSHRQRKISQLAKSFTVALPVELSRIWPNGF